MGKVDVIPRLSTVRRRLPEGLAAVATAAYAVVVFSTRGRGEVSQAIIVSGQSVAAFAAAFAAARTARARRSVGWLLVAIGALSWGIGEAAWTWYTVVVHREAPFPSMADFGFIGFMPFAIAGIATLTFGGSVKGERLRAILDGLAMAVSMLIVAWALFLAPVLKGDGSHFALGLSLAYPIADLIALALVLAAIMRVGNRWVLIVLALGFGTLALADSLFSYLVAVDTVASNGLQDVAWLAAFFLLMVAARMPDDAKPRPLELVDGLGRALLVAMPVGGAIATAIYEEATGTIDSALVWCGVALGLVLVARQFAIQIENASLTSLLESKLTELERSERRFRVVFDETSDVIVLIDGLGNIVDAGKAVERVLGWPASDVIGRSFLDFAHPDEIEALATNFAAFEGGPGIHEQTLRVRSSSGEWRWMEGVITDLRKQPEVGAFVCGLRDVSSRVAAEAEFERMRTRFVAAFELAPIGMALGTLDGRIFKVNRSMVGILGYEQEELEGRLISEITHPDDRAASFESMGRLRSGEISQYALEKRYLHRDGHVVWVSLSVSKVDEPDGTSYMIGQVEDITQRKAISERLAYSAVHDALTGLANRAKFVDRLDSALLRVETTGHRLAVLFLDVDRFKLVNDSLGHALGDELLKVVAGRLGETLREHDLVARFGGDEFTILVDPVRDEGHAMEIANRVLRALDRPMNLSSGETFVSASVGVALSFSGLEGEELLANADNAMYLAKQRGRGRVELFAQPAHARAAARLRTETDLHRALERDEFRVHYQPIVELGSGAITGFEALLRWEHPVRGLLAPASFISEAEETGLIVPMGRWVLSTACNQVRAWLDAARDEHAFFVNVNLSARQLASTDLVATVAEVLAKSGIPPGNLGLEITESGLMVDTDEALARLTALHETGVRLSIDDFGTGYSSLAYLKRFPVTSLKIDRSFVDGLGTDPEDTAIVAAVVELAHALGLLAVAEGVETVAQLDRLRALGCDYGQGWYFGRAVDAAELGANPVVELRSWQIDGRWVADSPEALSIERAQ